MRVLDAALSHVRPCAGRHGSERSVKAQLPGDGGEEDDELVGEENAFFSTFGTIPPVGKDMKTILPYKANAGHVTIVQRAPKKSLSEAADYQQFFFS